ncbi:hypothetical protein HanXRQr2_Chr16g0728371 [Helianthus annuus]|uniref:Uncharacterized protein n=1 Tax=Helianthus annuus TaxID=4232 RepID=A0A9K3GYL5_HELAN|nr:hypothetical protein HanXRQr2_Chr16g0728371 [Helianthus annuus]KAJ0819632.1 hypothetical protein HanPSC8_Chr16g0698291 [Helianthus annuus]
MVQETMVSLKQTVFWQGSPCQQRVYLVEGGDHCGLIKEGYDG